MKLLFFSQKESKEKMKAEILKSFFILTVVIFTLFSNTNAVFKSESEVQNNKITTKENFENSEKTKTPNTTLSETPTQTQIQNEATESASETPSPTPTENQANPENQD